jgi:hypothetical protein
MAYSTEEGKEYILVLTYYTYLLQGLNENVFMSNMLIEHKVNKLVYSVNKS